MSTALDNTVMERWFQQYHSGSNPLQRVRLVSIKTLHLKPARRCIIEYVCEIEIAEVTHTKIYLGKINARLNGELLFNLMQSLWVGGFNPDHTDGIRVPKPIGIVAECGMWIQEKVEGITVSALFRQDPKRVDLAIKIANVALKIKKTSAPVIKIHSVATELQILDNRLTRVIALRPELTKQLRSMILETYRLGRKISGSPHACAHRDFYPEQLLVCGDQITILDFDLYCMADAALDVGNFTAHLTEEGIREFGDPNYFSDIENKIVSTYLSGFDSTYSTISNMLKDIRIYYVFSLMRHIYICTLFEDRRHILPELLDHCDRLLSSNYINSCA